MNLPNLLSLSRVAALFVIAVLLPLPASWAGWAVLVTYILAALTDALDGWAARKWGMVTTLGKFLDALVDKIFVLGLLILLYGHQAVAEPDTVFLSQAPLLPGFGLGILVILTREFGVTGLRILAAQRQVVLAAEKGGKIKTALQMGSIGLLLLARASEGLPVLYTPAYFLGHGLFFLAVWQTIASGITYFHKYGDLLQEPPLDS